MPPDSTRRSFLRGIGPALGAGTVSLALAGCTDDSGSGPSGARAARGGGVGQTPGGVPAYPDISYNDRDFEVRTAGELESHTRYSDGRIVWLSDNIDLTGRDLTLEGITVASGRSADGSGGATIFTTEKGSDSHAWSRGSGTGLITLGENARLSGVHIRGPNLDESDNQRIPGYIPFAPQSSRSAREDWRRQRFARGVTILGDNATVDNCDIRGFSVQGISVGSGSGGNAPQNVQIRYTVITQCLMTSYGYCIDVRAGDVTVFRCYLDAARHAMCGSGMADANYSCLECTFGPTTISHPIDMHRVGNNVSGSSDPSDRDYTRRAGGTIIVRGCDIMPTRVPDIPIINRLRGDRVPHASIRGLPLDGFYFENNNCSHDDIISGINQSGLPGSIETGENGFARIYVSGNQWGVDFSEGTPQSQQQPQQQGQSQSQSQQPTQTGPRTDGAWIHEGFEGGADNMFEDPNDTGGYVPSHPDAIRIDDSFARAGQRSFKLTIDYSWDYPDDVRHGTNKPIPNGRDEMQEQGYSTWSEPFWFAFSLGIPPDWRPDSIGDQIHEFHRDISGNPGDSLDEMKDNAGSQSGHPLATTIYEDQIRILHETTDGSENIRHRQEVYPVSAGNWYDIVYQIKWESPERGGNGFIRCWINGEQVLDYAGPTAANDTNPPRPPELRIYKAPWNRDEITPDRTRISYNWDEVRYAFADAERSDVVPGER